MTVWDYIFLKAVAGSGGTTGTAPTLEPKVPTATTGKSFLDQFNSLFTSVQTILLAVAGAFAVLYLIWAGIQYIMAGGSADKVKAARASIINALIGVIVVIAVYAIIRFGVSIGNSINSAIQ